MAKVETTASLIGQRVRDLKNRAEIIAEGKRLFKALHVQNGDAAEYWKVGNPLGGISETVGIKVTTGGHQHLLIDEDEDTCRFYAWVINNFSLLTDHD